MAFTFHRLLQPFRRRRFEADMAAELQTHLELQAAANRAAGMDADEARYAARRQFGGVDQVKETARAQRGWVWLEQTGRDFRYALRSLRRAPGFTAVAGLLLALGIGGNTIVFSLVNGLFLRPLPFPGADRLVDIDVAAPQWNLRYAGINYDDFAAWREQNRTFAGMAHWRGSEFNVATENRRERLPGQRVTHDLADVFGLHPVLGRMFRADEEMRREPKVALIGDHLWQEWFGRDPAVLGKTLLIDAEAYEIIGVLPPTAVFPSRAAFWIPFDSKPGAWAGSCIGRLKPGVTVGQAAADLLRIHRGRTSVAKENAITFPVVQPLLNRYLGDGWIIAVVLLAGVVILLLVAGANVAGLMLARTLGRAPELGLRAALGASRLQILRQILAESLVLTLIGGAAGVLLGRWLLAGSLAFLVARMPAWISVEMDARVLGFIGLLLGLCALVAGLIPARHLLGRLDLRRVLGSGLHQITPPASRVRSLRLLVAAELGLATMLLLVGGLLGRAFVRVQQIDPGLRPDHLLVYGLSLPEAKYRGADARIAFFQQHLERLRALPDVESASASTTLPFTGTHTGNFFEPEGGRPGGPDAPLPVILTRSTFSGYFETMGIALVAGSPFQGREPRGIIVNETLARMFWPGKNAVGRHLRSTGPGSPWIEVVGVARDVRHYGLEADVRPGVYVPFRFDPEAWIGVVVRTKGDPSALAPTIRALLREQDATLSPTVMSTMEALIRQSLFLRRMYSTMTATFALIAAAMAAAGLYGIVAYVVGRRTREFGIRLALGARARDLRRLVLRQGLGLAAIGVGLGLAGGMLAAVAMRALLLGVHPFDPLVVLGIAVLLAVVVFAACLIPARRATRLDLVDVLRAE
ncbi:MAG TPA: ABC transporter permease [Opitutaceae bacterium]|nr:ABC transporter permease [Opitutaceae bacterium]